MGRPQTTGYKDQINVKMNREDKMMLKRAFGLYCEKHGSYDPRGYRRAFNEFCRQALMDRAAREIGGGDPPLPELPPGEVDETPEGPTFSST